MSPGQMSSLGNCRRDNYQPTKLVPKGNCEYVSQSLFHNIYVIDIAIQSHPHNIYVTVIGRLSSQPARMRVKPVTNIAYRWKH